MKNIRAFGGNFDVDVKRIAGGKLQVTVSEDGGRTQTFKVKQGTTIKVKL